MGGRDNHYCWEGSPGQGSGAFFKEVSESICIPSKLSACAVWSWEDGFVGALPVRCSLSESLGVEPGDQVRDRDLSYLFGGLCCLLGVSDVGVVDSL